MLYRSRISLFLIACLALTGVFAVVFGEFGSGQDHVLAGPASLQAASAATHNDDCPPDQESPGCMMVCGSGTCTGHFASNMAHQLISPTAKAVLVGTGQNVNHVLLVFDLLRPPRITL